MKKCKQCNGKVIYIITDNNTAFIKCECGRRSKNYNRKKLLFQMKYQPNRIIKKWNKLNQNLSDCPTCGKVSIIMKNERYLVGCRCFEQTGFNKIKDVVNNWNRIRGNNVSKVKE